MQRKFLALLILVGLGFSIGGMACSDTQALLDKSLETDGATG